MGSELLMYPPLRSKSTEQSLAFVQSPLFISLFLVCSGCSDKVLHMGWLVKSRHLFCRCWGWSSGCQHGWLWVGSGSKLKDSCAFWDCFKFFCYRFVYFWWSLFLCIWSLCCFFFLPLCSLIHYSLMYKGFWLLCVNFMCILMICVNYLLQTHYKDWISKHQTIAPKGNTRLGSSQLLSQHFLPLINTQVCLMCFCFTSCLLATTIPFIIIIILLLLFLL